MDIFDNEKLLDMHTKVSKLYDTVIGTKNEDGMAKTVKNHSDLINIGKGMFIVIGITVGFIIQHIF